MSCVGITYGWFMGSGSRGLRKATCVVHCVLQYKTAQRTSAPWALGYFSWGHELGRADTEDPSYHTGYTLQHA